MRNAMKAMLGLIVVIGAGCSEAVTAPPTVTMPPSSGPSLAAYPTDDQYGVLLPQLKFRPHTTITQDWNMGWIKAIGITEYFGNVLSVTTNLNVNKGSRSLGSDPGFLSGFDVPVPKGGVYRTGAIVGGISYACGITASARTYGYAALKLLVAQGMLPGMSFVIREVARIPDSHLVTASTPLCKCEKALYRAGAPLAETSATLSQLGPPDAAALDLECEPDSGSGAANGGTITTVCFDAYLIYESEIGVKVEEYIGQWCFYMEQ
jgi:hypothetical protein